MFQNTDNLFFSLNRKKLSFLNTNQMSKDIIGINLGSKNTVVGTYKNGVFEIVVSETSARSLPTAVSYNDRERNFAELSMHTNRSNFKRTIIYPNRWL